MTRTVTHAVASAWARVYRNGRPHGSRSGRRAAVGALRAKAHPPGPNVLLVVAHPDDEYYCAATVYRITQELGGTVDQLIITNGEGGYRYALLAERIYGHALTQEEVGRAQLPAIRRDEAVRAGRILGIRRHHFLDQPDVPFQPDLRASIEQVWDRPLIERKLDGLLQTGTYDFVFTVLPTEDTHPHHQAAALLTLTCVARVDEAERPVVLGCTYRSSTDGSSTDGAPTIVPVTRPEERWGRVLGDRPVFSFDRQHKFGFEAALDYAVVVHWMMAEYKSQGLFQTAYGVDDTEDLWYFSANAPVGLAKAQSLFRMLRPVSPAPGRTTYLPDRPRWHRLALPRWLYRTDSTSHEH